MTEASLVSPMDQDAAPDRPLGRAVLNGWKKCCPTCGAGPLLRSYLKVRDTCPVCGEELFHQRADDGPAYLTILIVGHLLAPVLLFIYARWEPDPTILAAVMSVGVVALSLCAQALVRADAALLDAKRQGKATVSLGVLPARSVDRATANACGQQIASACTPTNADSREGD